MKKGMMFDMKALIYDQPKQFSVKEIPLSQPGPDEIQISVQIAGVCGTDIHLHNGTFIGKYPLIPGHEMVGIIHKLGTNVNTGSTHFHVGQQVTVNGNYSCGECESCKQGAPLYCENLTCLGCNGAGAFAQYMIVPKRLVYDAEGLEPDQVVFTEPLACSCHGIDVLDPKPGSDVLLIGAGSTSAMLAQLLIHNGACRLTVAASKSFKLKLMREYGVDETVRIDRSDTEKSFEMLKNLRPKGFDIVIDATGAPGIQEKCTSLIRMGGTVMFYGVGRQDTPIKLDAYDVFARELTIKGSFAQVNSFSNALRMLRSGRIRTDGLITHHFNLNEWQKAMDTFTKDASAHKLVMLP